MEKSKSRTSRGIQKRILDITIPKNFNLEEKSDRFKKLYEHYFKIYILNLIKRNDICIFDSKLYITVEKNDLNDRKIYLSEKDLERDYLHARTGTIDYFKKYDHVNFYKNCFHKYIIYLVGSTYYMDSEFVSHHASCIIFDISKMKGFYFNPDAGSIEREKNICRKLEKLIAYSYYGTISKSNKIHISPLFIPDSPQKITRDRNCIFWSLLFIDIFIHFLTNDYNYSPEQIVTLVLEKYNTKDKLLTLIDQFKYYLLETNI
jgi:hypothetical protein